MKGENTIKLTKKSNLILCETDIFRKMEYESKDARSIGIVLTCGEMQKIKIRLYKYNEHKNIQDSKKITFRN